MFQRIFKTISRHKIIFSLIIIGLATGGYYEYKSWTGTKTETRYILASVAKGTIISSVSGSGQVAVSNQVDIKAKASGDIIFVGAKNGQEVKKGTLLAQIDAQEAQKAVRDAQSNLESAKLSLEKLKQPADELTLLQSEHSLEQANEAKQNYLDDLQKTYEDGFNTVANVFLDLPTIMAGLQDILLNNTITPYQQNLDYYTNVSSLNSLKAKQYRDDAYAKYQTARLAYDKNFQDYKSSSRFSETDLIEKIISQTYETTKVVAEAIKSANNLIQFYEDDLVSRSLKPIALADTHLASLNAYTGKTNTHLLNLLSKNSTIQSDKEAIVNADRSIAEKTESLANLKAGPNTLDVQSQELSIKQRENALLDAREKLNDYYIRAPFDGIVAKMNVKVGDPSSASAAIATLISKQGVAEIALNEVDAAKVKVGQKTTITFDAIEGLSISGEVQEIDTLGTVSQGVVTYNVKIGFDTQDAQIKPGMSLNAAIITDVKQDVLIVPNSAVKTQNNQRYVEMLDQTILPTQGNQGVVSPLPPRQQLVKTGLANDTSTEIISGLNEGDKIIIKTTTTGATTTSTQQNSAGGLRIPDLPGVGGGGFRRD